MKRILIVDDEKNIRVSLEHCTKNQGYEVDNASDGNEAINMIRNNKYDLILMDYQIPNKNGVDILKLMRSEGIETNVIIMTAYGTVDVAVDSMKLGAVDFISKPFTLKKIKSMIKTILENEESLLRIDKSVDEYIRLAIKSIENGELEKGRLFLKEALVIDTSNPAVQNLLGAIEELSNNKLLAQKYYRAALSLDATYKPADNNLRRTAMYYNKDKEIDLGKYV